MSRHTWNLHYSSNGQTFILSFFFVIGFSKWQRHLVSPQQPPVRSLCPKCPKFYMKVSVDDTQLPFRIKTETNWSDFVWQFLLACHREIKPVREIKDCVLNTENFQYAKCVNGRGGPAVNLVPPPTHVLSTFSTTGAAAPLRFLFFDSFWLAWIRSLVWLFIKVMEGAWGVGNSGDNKWGGTCLRGKSG